MFKYSCGIHPIIAITYEGSFLFLFKGMLVSVHKGYFTPGTRRPKRKENQTLKLQEQQQKGLLPSYFFFCTFHPD